MCLGKFRNLKPPPMIVTDVIVWLVYVSIGVAWLVFILNIN